MIGRFEARKVFFAYFLKVTNYQVVSGIKMFVYKNIRKTDYEQEEQFALRDM
mgnify:FL=1